MNHLFIIHRLCFYSWFCAYNLNINLMIIWLQNVSAILSTEDHSELMQSIASKSSCQFFNLPTVPSTSSEESRDEHSQGGEIDANGISLENIGRSSKKISVLAFRNGRSRILWWQFCGSSLSSFAFHILWLRWRSSTDFVH